MRKKTARTQGTDEPRHVVHRGLTAKADEPLERSAATECGLDNRSHRTDSEFCWRRPSGDKAVAYTPTHHTCLTGAEASEDERSSRGLSGRRQTHQGYRRSSNSLLGCVHS